MQSWLQQQVANNGEGIAIRYEGQSYTFSKVYDLVNKKIKKIHPIITNERRVGLIGKNSFDMYLTILTLWELHREIVFLNFRLTKYELDYQMKTSHLKVVIGDEEQGDKFNASEFYSFSDVKQQVEEETIPLDWQLSKTEVASIMFTSGTTGKPKGVIQTFSNHQANALAAEKNLLLTSKDEWLCVTPIIHVSGLSIICRSLLIGLTLHLMRQFDEEIVTEKLKNEPITVVSVVTLMLDRLMKVFPKEGYSDRFRFMLLGGGSVPVSLLHTCEKNHVSVVQSFGMTETCSQLIALSQKDALKKIGSAGLPLLGVEIMIDSPNENGVGQIFLKGPQVIQSYLEKANAWTENGWFKTGDLGYLDDEGYLFIKSRMKELIISGGENIYPAEIESVFHEIKEVEAIAVVGKPHAKWGQVPVAYVETKLKVPDLIKYGESRLAKYKLPNEWHLVEKLPRTTSGKINKSQLMKEIEINE